MKPMCRVSMLIGLLMLVGCSDSANLAPADPPTVSDSPEPAEAVVVKAADISASRMLNANNEPGNWLSHGRTYDEQRYSPRKQISDSYLQMVGIQYCM